MSGRLRQCHGCDGDVALFAYGIFSAGEDDAGGPIILWEFFLERALREFS
jgi:hypothetical protein